MRAFVCVYTTHRGAQEVTEPSRCVPRSQHESCCGRALFAGVKSLLRSPVISGVLPGLRDHHGTRRPQYLLYNTSALCDHDCSGRAGPVSIKRQLRYARAACGIAEQDSLAAMLTHVDVYAGTQLASHLASNTRVSAPLHDCGEAARAYKCSAGCWLL
jgi:hypothetical protein